MPAHRLLVPFAFAFACSAPVPAPSPPPEGVERVRRFAAILDYVAADYAGAVVDGKIASEAEYAEQLDFLRDATSIAAKLEDPALGEGAARVRGLVEAMAPAEDVAGEARALRRRALDTYGVVLAPATPPSRERGAELYAQSCVRCHGATGGADGIEAANLDPRPRSFRDPAVMADLFPARAYNTLTDGVPGTAMASFGTLSAADRWSLAFHVFALRHEPASVARGEDAYARARGAIAAAPTRLAGASDAEIDQLLGAAGLDPEARRDALAWLRAEAPYRASGAALDPARRMLERGLARYRDGDPEGARQLVAGAYLDGFDPYEGALRTRDAALVLTIEQRFLDLRQRISAGAAVAEIERDALNLGVLLDRAEERLGSGAGAARAGSASAFVSALLIILREGFEAALLIMLLLGMARRGGTAVDASRDVRAIHLGWIGAALLGLIAWFASGAIVRMGGGRREIVEGVTSLVAAAVLLAAGHFVLARADAQRRVEAIKRRLAEKTAGARRLWVFAGLAFLAVFREAFEVVLFLRTIALDPSHPGSALLAGVASGAILLIGAVYLIRRLGRRVKPGPLLAAMGTLLCVLAVILAGKGVHALQAADVLPLRAISAPAIEWLGFYPTLQGLAAQLLVLAAFVAIAVVAWRGAAPGAPARPGSGEADAPSPREGDEAPPAPMGSQPPGQSL